MRLADWFRRPLAEVERGRAFAAASATLVALALGALLLLPQHHAARVAPRAGQPRPHALPPQPAARPAPDRTVLVADAREFLSGYLPYLYEGADAQSVPRASFALRRALARHRPRRAPRRAPRVRLLDVQILSLAPARARALATLVDESGATFPVRITLRTVGERWEASDLGR